MQELPAFKISTKQLISDYGHAILHLAWYRNDRQRSLVFGMVELLPKEFPEPTGTDEESLRVGNEGRRCLYMRRFTMPVNQAIEWYENCLAGIIWLPESGWDKPCAEKKQLDSSLAQEPYWPQLNTASELPFVPDWHNCPRVHHLIPTGLSNELEKLKYEKLEKYDGTVINWLSEQFYFNFEDYPEYFGSLHLVAPNPVIRRFENRLIHDNNSSGEAEIYHFIPRAGYSLHGLQLIIAEQRPTGIASIRCIQLELNELRVEYPHYVERVATAIVCPQRGVLYWSGPLGFIGSIGVNTYLTTANKQVTVPASQNRGSDTYNLSVKEEAFSQTIGTINQQPREAALILWQAETQRKQRQEGQRFGQQWFHGNQQEAEQFVRNLVTQARTRVIIVDPYFGVRELFNFAVATSHPQTKVCILSSAEVLKEKDPIDPNYEVGELLLKQLQQNSQLGHLSIHVMTGHRPEIHDRFLIIDDEVWLSGNSLNEIGNRAGVIVKLPYPQPIVANIEDILNRCPYLSAWVQTRQANKTNSTVSVGPP